MSTRLNGLREKHGQVIDKIEALLAKAADETRALTDAEKTELADLEKDADRTEESIKVEARLEARKGATAKPVPGQRASVPAQSRLRVGKLRAFKGEGAEDLAYRAGRWAQAILFDNEKAAEWCRENGVSIAKAQSEGGNTAGGFLVPTEFNQAIIDLRETYGTFRQELTPVPMGSDSMTVPRRSGGVTAYWTGENAQITESQKTWDQVNLVAKKLAALTRMSTELDQDAVINIGDDLAAEMAYAFAKAEDAAGWNGDGTSTSGGIRGVFVKVIDGTHTKSAINAASGHDTFAEIDKTDLANLQAPLPKYALPNAKWYTSQVGWSLVFQALMAAAGGNTMTDLSGKPIPSYLGYPVVIDQSLPTSTGSLVNLGMIGFGDLSKAATMGERRGFTLKKSDDRYFEYDQIGIMGTERVDIVVHDLGDTTNAGPFNVLVGA